MANPDLFFSYKETRLDLDPTTHGSTVFIRLPSHGASTSTPKTAQKRPHVVEIPVAEDESSFKQRHLAIEASIYHRTHHKSPRSFLWRILDDGRVLSIRVMDVCRQVDATDKNVTLRLSFQSPILARCIAFSDSKDHDVLSAFVLTESKHLYTLTLRPEYFRHPSSTENNAVDWCKSYLSSALSLKNAHRLVALSADELLVSFVDGGLLRLGRNSGGDGSVWKETHYNEGGWSLRGIFQNANSIRFGKHNIDLSAATSIASPKIDIDGMSYAFMVSLDHRLRVWNLSTGKMAYMGDLLNQELEPHDNAKQVIPPSYSQLVKVYGNHDESAFCITYSPLGTGQFKFWLVNPAEDANLEVTDLFPNNVLEPQLPNSEIWTLSDFSVEQDHTIPRCFTLWALWKNNTTYRVHKLDFESDSISRLSDAWKHGWKAMAIDNLVETLPHTASCGDPSDVTDKWLEYILSPTRFSKATLETGLAIYERGLGSAKDSLRRSGSLPERLCSTIASTVSLVRASDGSMDYEQFRIATDSQWRRLYRLLLEINRQRGEALSMTFDLEGRMPWVTLADGVTAIRDCTALERIWHNNNNVPAGTEHVARLILTAANFRDTFSDQFLYNCKTALLAEIFQEPSLTAPAIMQAIYIKCDFANQIGDEEYCQLVAGFQGGFKDVTPEVYGALLELLNGSGGVHRLRLFPLAEYGNKLVIKGVQDTVELHRNICLDQLILLILIEAEVNHGEDGIGFDTGAVFSQLLITSKRLELIHWLAHTQISLPLKNIERSSSIIEKSTISVKKQIPTTETVTILEGVLRHLFGLDVRGEETMTSAVAEIIVQICSPTSEYEAPTAVIQCFLLAHDRADLALEFARFANDDAFSTYIQGRACLAADDAVTAAMLLKKAAFGMAYSDSEKRIDHRSAGYLDETEKRLLNAGLSEYYSHIVSLYDKIKLFSFVIDFARLALQFIKSDTENGQVSHLRTEMHSRLFNAAIHTSRYELAHSILTLFTDSALQHSSLRILIIKMCESSYTSQLVDLPFIGLQDAVDEILEQKCQSIVDVTIGVPYHKILYAWRIKRSDFRGAASVSLERLRRLQQSGDGDKMLGTDGLETPVTRQFVALINALSCVDPKEAWIFSQEPAKKPAKVAQPKRTVVTLENIRKAHQEELDRIAAIDNNQFALSGGDEMDVL